MDQEIQLFILFFLMYFLGRKIVEKPHNLVFLTGNIKTIKDLKITITDQNNQLLNLRHEHITIRFHIREIQKLKVVPSKMAMYQQVKLNISDNQKDKIQHALKNNIPVTIRITEIGNDVLALTKREIHKLEKALSQNKGVDITLSRKQIKYNMKIEGGFLHALAAMVLVSLSS